MMEIPAGFTQIGEIGKPHHLQGGVVIYSEWDLLELNDTEPVFLFLEGAPVPFYFAEGEAPRRRSTTSYLARFDYVDSKEQAERLTGAALLLEDHLLPEEEEEEEDEPGLEDLVGFRVTDILSGADGEVTDVADYSGNIVLTVEIFSKEILLPWADRYIKEVLEEEQLLHVEIPSELIELY